MAEYYLISQLPSLDGVSDNVPLPITEERFTELCRRFLSSKILHELESLSLAPSRCPQKSSYALVEKWNEGERTLRLALAKLRADKMGKSFESEVYSFPPNLLQAARAAVEFESPMEAEKFLNRFRLALLEELRPMDGFADEYIFYYGLRLKLLLRVRQFDTEAGEAAYRDIYNSILYRDRLEALS